LPKTKEWLWCAEKQSEGELHFHALKANLFSGKTPFQEVGLMDSYHFGKILMLDGDIQSAQKDEFIYHESLVHPALILHPNPKRVAILGGGEGATLREILTYPGVEKVVMIDIDEQLVRLAEEHLSEWHQGAFKDPRVELVFGDALVWNKENQDKFDIIVGDLTEPLPDSPSYMLCTVEFFNTLKKNHLNPDGIYVMQASVADYLRFELHARIAATLSRVFKTVRPFASRVPSFDTVWGFAMASDNHDPLNLNGEEVNRRIKERLSKTLEYYDGETHAHIFHLPKTHRWAMETYNTPLRDADMMIPAQSGTSF